MPSINSTLCLLLLLLVFISTSDDCVVTGFSPPPSLAVVEPKLQPRQRQRQQPLHHSPVDDDKDNVAIESNDSISIQALSSDPFMKQVSYAEQIVSEMSQVEAERLDTSGSSKEGVQTTANILQDKLTAMLSHADGIRGFFVTYLTAVQSPADNDVMMDELKLAMFSQANSADDNELIQLVCMNVVMPTGMITMHSDKELRDQSRITAERGLRILCTLLEEHPTQPDVVQENCRAILKAVTDDVESDDGVAVSRECLDYWNDFVQKWGYQELQKRDIAQAMKSALSVL